MSNPFKAAKKIIKSEEHIRSFHLFLSSKIISPVVHIIFPWDDGIVVVRYRCELTLGITGSLLKTVLYYRILGAFFTQNRLLFINLYKLVG